MCECIVRSLDMKTPYNVYFTAFYKRSFAFQVIDVRTPAIITQTINDLIRNKNKVINDFGEESQGELQNVISELSKLKCEIKANQTLRPLTSDASDIEFYNKYLEQQNNESGRPTYYHTFYLLMECYIYRRIREAFENTRILNNFDPFRKQKKKAYCISSIPMLELCKYILPFLDGSMTEFDVHAEFIILLKLNLWANKCDLALSLGEVPSHSHIGPLESVQYFEKNILCDHSEDAWLAVSDGDSFSDIVDIVLDNSGFELFTDLCLCDYIIANKFAEKIRFYVKTMPWFISDVMTFDFYWMIEQLNKNDNDHLKKLGKRWNEYVQNGTWTIVENDFWILPVDFSLMSSVNSELYQQLSEAKLIIFKGDLNYRKLFGDKNWNPITPIQNALQNFHPAKLCALRTVKSPIICGLVKGLVETLEKDDENWMLPGNYGLIQFCGLVNVSHSETIITV